ncbi:MAG: hypothetical protein L3K19_00815 [Thermoplasmata archaeon]|nr:hypothetical protein [Thermoplasmata archaeon]
MAQPTHLVLRSIDPAASNLVGLALVSAASTGFALLEIREHPAAPGGWESPWSRLVPDDRHMISFAPARHPEHATPGLEGSWPIFRADQPDRPISYLPEFLASPEASGQALRHRLAIPKPATILIVNGGLVARRFPDDPTLTGRLMSVQKQFGHSVVLAADETHRRDYSVFDYLFDVLPSGAGWGSTRVRCARAPSSALMRAGDEFTLNEVGGFEALAERWRGSQAGTAEPPSS